MKAKKLLAMVLALLLVISMAACTNTDVAETTGGTTSVESTTEATVANSGNEEVAAPASIDFEDGSMSFVALYEGKANCDASVLEVVDYNGGKALKATNGSGKVPYVAFDVTSLLGANAGNVASVEMTLGLEHPDGTFYAASGNVITWCGADLVQYSHAWSVYLESKNPKTSVITLDTANGEVFASDVPNVMMVTLEDDNGLDVGAANANLYIDNIRFLDASGNLITADTTVSFNGPAAFAADKDMSNLKYLAADATLLDGSAISGAGWAQTDVGSAVDQWLPLMVPGAVIEIEYTSEDGAMWIVLPDAANGWTRVNADNGVAVQYNNSKNIAQITYEQIAAVLGEDTSTWGGRIQCEASSNWEVYSVKIGQNSGMVHTGNKTLLDGSAITGAGWAQTDVGSAVDQWLPLMVPGAVIEIEYTSEDGTMWIVLPDAANGWTRVNADNGVTPAANGSICQITYEQIASILGEDTSTWGGRIQCEAMTNWEVYSVSICGTTMVNTVNNVLVDASAVTGAGWAQADTGATAETIATLVPGSVITIQYTSTNGDMWIVLPDAANGWTRVNADNGVTPAWDGATCQITYEQIASILGEDTSTWGGRIQVEASGDYEVYAVYIGTAA